MRRRFIGERDASPATEAIAKLRPLSGLAAAAIAEVACERHRVNCRDNLTFRSDDPPGIVGETLRGLPPSGDTPVIVSWDRDTALATNWGFFVARWDDFCYPASDDVTIWSLADDWTLSYRHYEVFQFSRG